jgi:2-polyprenyl-3-methyl-5-hydroxy-6-metoxy-1,4-benzoquinol methylase
MLSLLRRAVRAFRNRYSSPQDYWNRRYRRLGSAFTGPGCIDIGERENSIDYDEKWSHLRNALQGAIARGAEVLDAGCGNGSITQYLVAEGYRVTAVDFSAAALDAARSRNLPGVVWMQSSLDAIETPKRFDAVVCIDVVHHIVDDAIFRRTIERLCMLTAEQGVLIVQTHFPEGDAFATEAGQASAHVRWRTRDEFRAALPKGFEVRSTIVFELPHERATKEIWEMGREGGGRRDEG